MYVHAQCQETSWYISFYLNTSGGLGVWLLTEPILLPGTAVFYNKPSQGIDENFLTSYESQIRFV